MARRLSLLLMILLAQSAWAGASQPPPLYHQVVGGPEDYQVPGKTTLGLLATTVNFTPFSAASRPRLVLPGTR